MNDSTAISSFHCLSARSRATRGRSRRWKRETTPHRRENLTRSRAGTGNRARHGRPAANARTAPTALRRPRAFADQHPFVVTRQSIRITPSRSRGRVDQRAARSFEFLLIAIAARRARARRLSSFFFAGFPFVPFVRSVRIAVGGLPRSSCRPPPASSSSFSPSPRLGFESRARSLSRHRDFHSFVWVDEVLGFTSHDCECTRAQTTTSYDSRYMECTPGYIRWRSSRRLESRPPRSRRSSRAIDGARTRFRPRRSRAIVRSFVRSFVPSRRSSSTLSVSDVHTLDRENHRPRGTRRRRRRWDEIVFELLTVLVRRAGSERTPEDVRDVSALAQVVSTSETKETTEERMTTRRDREYVGSCAHRR